MEEKTSIYLKGSMFYRPTVEVENKGKFLISNIKVYNDNGVIVSIDGSDFGGEYSCLEINGKVVYKIKENFNKKINYVLSNKEYTLEKSYTLYIYVDNVDFKVIDILKDNFGLIYKHFSINEIDFKIPIINLSKNIYNYKNLIEEETNELKSYKFPFEPTELEKICNNITKYNNLILEEEKWIKEYKPTIEDLKDNFKTALKRNI